MTCNSNPYSCDTCRQTPCSCSRSLRPAPSPYYNQAGIIQETHCQSIIQQYYATAISSSTDFVMPICGGQSVIKFPNVTQIQVGSYLWNYTAGYLRVSGFDSRTGDVLVVNECILGNAAPGTSVPKCSLFTVTDTPVGVTQGNSTISANGSLLGDATPISTRITFVTGGDGVKGVSLPINPASGTERIVYNTSASILKIYPGEAGDWLCGVVGGPFGLAGQKGMWFHAQAVDTWWGGQMV